MSIVNPRMKHCLHEKHLTSTTLNVLGMKVRPEMLNQVGIVDHSKMQIFCAVLPLRKALEVCVTAAAYLVK